MTTTYGTQHELRHSQDDFLVCTECDIAIDPGDRLVYLFGAKEGFLFYHPGCIDVEALRDTHNVGTP